VTNDAAPYLEVGPDHSHAAALKQLGDANRGFVASFVDAVEEARRKALEQGKPAPELDVAKKVMRSFDPAGIPVMSMLARRFTVCRRWFASVPGETWPNRNYAHASTSHGQVNIKLGFYWDPTIFERLGDAKRSWRIYHEGPAQTWAFPRLWMPFWRHRFKNIKKLYKTIEKDELDNYSFVEPDHGLLPYDKTSNSQHPGNNTDAAAQGRDFVAGEKLIADIYAALRANPKVFRKTLFIITYDEHGGLYDHKVPPAGVQPDDDVWTGSAGETFSFDRLGVRVPAILISPWLPAQVIDDQRIFDHSSIVKSLRKMWKPEIPALTRRDASDAVATFHDLPALAAERTDLPEVSPLPLPDDTTRSVTLRAAGPAAPEANAGLDGFQESLVALADNVSRTLDEEGSRVSGPDTRSAAGTATPSWSADPAEVAARFGTSRELREYMEYVTRRLQAAVDELALDLTDTDGRTIERASGDDVRRAFAAQAATPGARGKVSLRNPHDVVVLLDDAGSLRQVDLETGTEKTLSAPSPGVRDVGDAADLAAQALSALGRDDLI
jgi:phospholipase C